MEHQKGNIFFLLLKSTIHVILGFVSFEVFGGWSNTRSCFGCVVTSNSEWIIVDTPNILNSTEAKEFYIGFNNNTIEAGAEGEPAFFDVNCTCPIDWKYIGVATGYGGNAEWTYCQESGKLLKKFFCSKYVFCFFKMFIF